MLGALLAIIAIPDPRNLHARRPLKTPIFGRPIPRYPVSGIRNPVSA